MSADEIWITKDGHKIAVGDMSEQHVRNALRMILRQRRRRREQFVEMISEPSERPDNPTILLDLRQRHGDAVRVEHKSVAGMSGGDVYVGDQRVGWFGGI